MYIPKHTAVTDRNEIFEMIECFSFAVIVTCTGGQLKASHIPILLDRSKGEMGSLYGHVSAANDQKLITGDEALVIFSGPHSYISSSWYETDQSVPTWNYSAVHAYGTIELKNQKEEKLDMVRRLVEHFESGDSAYSVSSLREDYLNGLLKGITAFSIRINRLEGKKKLSQNHSEERQALVIENLQKLADPNALEIAKMMRKNIDKKHDRK